MSYKGFSMEIKKMPINHFNKRNTKAIDHLNEPSKDHASENDHQVFMGEIWEEASKLRIYSQIDTNADWKLISERIVEKFPVNYRKIPWYSYYLRIAALLILTFGLSLGFYKIFVAHNKQAETGFTSQIADNQIKDIVLPDGSVVTLNKGSRLTFRDGFGILSRDVILEGEALFNVVPGASLPFKVFVGESVVEVTGTSFSVQEKDGEVKVSVISGKVILSSAERIEKKISVAANQSGYVLTNSELKVEDGLSANVLSWKTGHLIFDQTPLDSALMDIAHHFGKELSIETGIKEEITAEFKDQPLKEILNELRLVAGLQFDTTGIALIVRK
jgi:ferric-dicitrate binding protein FerR (iron transport regulator)